MASRRPTIHLDVLERQRVDARWDQRDLGVVEPVPHVGAAGEHERAGALDERANDIPGRARHVARHVDADVADPDHAETRREQSRDEPGRLRVVHDGDIARPHHRERAVEVPLRDRRVVRDLRGPERAEVAEVAVEPVVDPFRDLEERWVALEDQPPHLQVVRVQIAEVRAKEFRHPAAFGGGVDVPERPAVEARGGLGERGREALDVAVAHRGEELCRGTRVDCRLVHGIVRG